MIAEQRTMDASVLTRKSRRENAREGFDNGVPVAFVSKTYIARHDGEKGRMKLENVPEEAAILRQVFDWVDAGRGGR